MFGEDTDQGGKENVRWGHRPGGNIKCFDEDSDQGENVRRGHRPRGRKFDSVWIVYRSCLERVVIENGTYPPLVAKCPFSTLLSQVLQPALKGRHIPAKGAALR